VRDAIDHLTEVELTRLLDGEMEAAENTWACSHVRECDRCNSRLAEIAQISAELKEVDAILSGSTIEASHARASLASRLSQESGSDASVWERMRGWTRTRMTPSFGYGALAAVGIVTVLFSTPNLHRSVAEMAMSLPNRALTPGATRSVSVAEVCAAGDVDLDPTVPASRQETVFQEYGIAASRSEKDFQVDYLISPQLGGTDDVRNLWPQSYKQTTWNATAKDALERHLYRMVCDRKIELAEAQREISTDWIAAYQKYFQTRKPS
jgi:hypothetical protein